MNCPRCDSPLEDPQAKFCPLCGANISTPERAPQPVPEPLPVAEPAAPNVDQLPAPGDAPPASAHCAVHAERVALDICSRCGSFACRECLVIGADGQGVCSACLTRQGGQTGPLPWENRHQLGFFKAYWETTKNIMFNPNTAFDKMEPETGQWWDPISYAIFSNYCAFSGTALIYALAGGIGFIAAAAQSGSKEMSPGIMAGIVLAMIVGFAIFIPMAALMVIFIGGGIEHLALKLVGVETRPFEATMRTYCYAMAPMFWGVVPFCGAYAYPIWQIVCRIFGYKSVHRTTGGKAAAGVLLPTLVCCTGAVLVYGIGIAAMLASKH